MRGVHRARRPRDAGQQHEHDRGAVLRAVPRRGRELQPVPAGDELGGERVLADVEARRRDGVHRVDLELRFYVRVFHVWQRIMIQSADSVIGVRHTQRVPAGLL